MNKAARILIIALAWPLMTGADVSNSRTAAISIIGFYNSESTEFQPKRIGYGALISFRDAHDSLRSALEADGLSVSEMGEFESGFPSLSQEDKDVLGQAVAELQVKANSYLHTGEHSELTCSMLRLPDFSSHSSYEGWNVDSEIYLLLGLETLSPSGKGLRSGVIAALFDGTGDCRDVSAVEYDFTNYNSSLFVNDGKRLILDLRRSDGPNN